MLIVQSVDGCAVHKWYVLFEVIPQNYESTFINRDLYDQVSHHVIHQPPVICSTVVSMSETVL